MSHVDIIGVHPGALGDCILFARALQQLDGRVRFVGPGAVGRMLVGLGIVAEAVDFNILPIHELFAKTDTKGSRLRQYLGSCDRLVTCFPPDNTAVRRRLADICQADELVHLPIRPPGDYAKHLVDLWGETLGPTVTAERIAETAASVPAEWLKRTEAILNKTGINDDYVLFHPGAGSPDKHLPIGQYIELAQTIHRDAYVIYLSGPVEQDRNNPVNLKEMWPELTTLACPPLDILCGLQKFSWCYIGNDTGPSHLAATLGVATAAMFISTSYQHFRPLGPRVMVVDASAEVPMNLANLACRIGKMAGIK